MRYVTAILVAMVLVTPLPVAAERVTSIDGMALRENVLSLDHEWIRPNSTSAAIKVALGRQVVDTSEMTLLGGAIGKRWYIGAPENSARSIYAGTYLYGQQVRTVDGSEVESQTALGAISELGFRVKTRFGPTLDMGPAVTIPVYARANYPDGEIADVRFPAITTSWKVGLGISW